MEFMELVSGFAQNLAVALMPVLVGYVVFWVKAQLDVKKAELQKQYPVQFAFVEMVAAQAVAAAEQAGANEFIDDKLAFACDLAEKWMAQSNFVVDLDLIAAGQRDVAALRGWRKEVFGNDALRLCDGKVALAAKGGNVIAVDLD